MEVLVVVAITLVIAGMTIPNMLPVISNARVHSGVTSVGFAAELPHDGSQAEQNPDNAVCHRERATLLGYIKPAADSSALKDTDSQRNGKRRS